MSRFATTNPPLPVLSLARSAPPSRAFARRLRAAAAAALLCALSFAPARAVDEFDLPPAKHTRLGLYMRAIDAHAALREGRLRVLFVDVRTPAELAFVGVAEDVDANVPFLEIVAPHAWDSRRQGLALRRNPEFVAAVMTRLADRQLTLRDPVILICRSGDRSAPAANALADAGFRQVYTVVDGFEGDLAMDGPLAGRRALNGWKVSGLPWSYKLDRDVLGLGEHPR